MEDIKEDSGCSKPIVKERKRKTIEPLYDADGEMIEKGRVQHLAIFHKFVLPLFPKYFEDVVRKREENHTWHAMSAVFDIFQVTATKIEGDETKQEGKVMCVIPCPRGFWDAWLSIYHLENPKVYKEQRYVAQIILNHINDTKMDPAGYINLEPYHLGHLIDIATIGKTNLFLDDPLDCIFMLKAYPMIEVARGEREPIEFMENDEKMKIEMYKMKEALRKELEDFIDPWSKVEEVEDDIVLFD